jgi:hypothetical protein
MNLHELAISKHCRAGGSIALDGAAKLHPDTLDNSTPNL